MSADIAILLATYNGAAFLSQQLDSLFAQTNQDWHLLVRDDLSSDESRSVLKNYQIQHQSRITIISDEGKSLGASGNFGALLTHADAPYTMFCDQDDVWLPDKIEITLAAIKEMECKYGKKMPLLIHTDLKVVDANLVLIDDSFWRFSGIFPARMKSLNRVLMQNSATGCTVMVNRALADLASPIPMDACMHDWWLALVGICFGKVHTIEKSTVLYRQHSGNDCGATSWRLPVELYRFLDYSSRNADIETRNALLQRQVRQAKAFIDRFHDRLTDEQINVLCAFCQMHSSGFLKRRYLAVRHGFLYSNRIANVGMLLFR